MNINGYHHIGLKVRDMDASLRFYTEGLGGTVVHSFPMGSTGQTIYLIDLGGNAVVELLPGGYAEPETNARWAHIALRAEDARAAHAQALAAGATERSAPGDADLGGLLVTNSFVYGPDKEVIEFFEVRA